MTIMGSVRFAFYISALLLGACDHLGDELFGRDTPPPAAQNIVDSPAGTAPTDKAPVASEKIRPSDGRRPAASRPSPAATPVQPQQPANSAQQLALVPVQPSLPSEPKLPVEPPQIVGLTEVALLGTLGRPDELQDAPPAKVWHYRGSGCELDIFLYLDVARNRFHALQYNVKPPHDTPAARDMCLMRLREDAAKR
jgi:hypothetical protein